MNHNQQISLVGHPDDHIAFFVDQVNFRDRDRKRVIEDGAGLSESDAVLPLIRRVFSVIPLKRDSLHLFVESNDSRASLAYPLVFLVAWQEIADSLLAHSGVACLNGAGFGEFGEGYIRFSCANSCENLMRAVERIQAWTGKRT